MRRLALVLLLGLVAACGGGTDDEVADDTTTTEAPAEDQDDVALMLASIDTGRQVDADHPAVAPIASVLDDLETQCDNTRTELGDMAVRATQLVEENGGQTPTVAVMLENVNMAIPADWARQDCAEMFAGVVTVMVG